MMGKLIAHKKAMALKDGETYSEDIAGKDSGSLLLMGRKTKVIAYYRYTTPEGSRRRISLGHLSSNFTIKNAREECQAFRDKKKQNPHLIEHIKSEAMLKSRKLAKEATTGTLAELLLDYTAYLAAQGKTSAKTIEKALDTVVIKANPILAETKAKDIEPLDIKAILTPMSVSQNYVYRNRVRSYLHAAFKFGLDREYDETRKSDKAFNLTINPVAAIPVLKSVENNGKVQSVESEGTRSLDDEELKAFYLNVSEVNSVGIVMATLMRFLIATGGQRPTQVLQVPWSDYDLKEGHFKIVDKKGRGSKPRVHIVPLTPRAKALLKELKPITGGYEWPFTSAGRAPISIESLKNVAKRYLASDFGKETPHFTARDLRRTCKQVMTRAQIPRDQRNLIQNHGFTGVDAKHYDNDPMAHLPAKKTAMARFDRALANVLDKELGGNVVELLK